MISRLHNGTIILWAFNFIINPDLNKYGRGFNVHLITPSHTSQSAAKWTALINVVPTYYYIQKNKKKQP
jgi:hypothetical protein